MFGATCTDSGQSHPSGMAGNSPVYSHGCKSPLPVADEVAGKPGCRTSGRNPYFRYSSQGCMRAGLHLGDHQAALRRVGRGLRLGAPHRRAAGPAHPPRPHPGDERRELPPQAQQGERCSTSLGRIRQPISRARSRPHSLTHPACCQPASVTLLPNNWRGHLRWPMTSLVVHFCSAPLVCFVDALDTPAGLRRGPLRGPLHRVRRDGRVGNPESFRQHAGLRHIRRLLRNGAAGRGLMTVSLTVVEVWRGTSWMLPQELCCMAESAVSAVLNVFCGFRDGLCLLLLILVAFPQTVELAYSA